MNFPVPRPPVKPKSIVSHDASKNTKSHAFTPSDKLLTMPGQQPKIRNRKRLTTYICTLPNDQVVEVRVEKPEEVVDACIARHKMSPVEFRKKPFERQERLTTRPLMENSKLADLKKQLYKNGEKK